MPFAAGLAAASPAAADECDALAVAVSGATFLKASKRAADDVRFDAGPHEVILGCFSGRIWLRFSYHGADDERFPSPAFLLLFSQAASSISHFDAFNVLYKKTLECLQSAARDKTGTAQVDLSDEFHYLACSVSGPWPSTTLLWPRVAYHDDHVMDRPD